MRVCHVRDKKGIPMIDLKRYRALGKKVAVVGGGAVLLGGLAGTVAGQGSSVPGLPSTPGLTELQQPVANTLQSVCVLLPPPNANGNPTERLSNSCTKMVVSSFANQGA